MIIIIIEIIPRQFRNDGVPGVADDALPTILPPLLYLYNANCTHNIISISPEEGRTISPAGYIILHKYLLLLRIVVDARRSGARKSRTFYIKPAKHL